MIGISDIESYIPKKRLNNYSKKDRFAISDEFIENKLGVQSVSRSEANENASDMCCTVFKRLIERNPHIDIDKIDALVVCTQNPDYNLPHTSAIVHGKLGLPEQCAAFDISIGCSGYVYGLAAIESFMRSAGMKTGLLFTADPYSKIIDTSDKNTSLLFGDAATVTYISSNPFLVSTKFTFGTRGKDFEHLICRDDKLIMNGREIFNFAVRVVPSDVKKVLKKNNLKVTDIDKFIFHQGSKYIVDFLIKRMELPKEKVPFKIYDYGNTVSSSIPLILKDHLKDTTVNRILISGFGVGLSWASGILTRNNN